MSIYFSPSNLGFYDTNIIGIKLPDDAKFISSEIYQQLMEAQFNGKLIRPDVNGEPCAVDYIPSEEELLENCKRFAKTELKETDWVEIPSVSDTTQETYLLNYKEFIDYRVKIRTLLINPVVDFKEFKRPSALWK